MRQRDVEGVVHLPEFHAAVHLDLVLRDPVDRYLGNIGLVLDLPDEFLDHVLQGDQTVGASEFVRDDTHMDPSRLKVTEELRERERTRDKEGVARETRQGDPPLAPHGRLVGLADMQDSRDVVDVLPVDGDAGVGDVAELEDDVVQCERVLPREDVYPRHHDVPRRQLVYPECAFDEEVFLLLDDPLAPSELGDFPQLPRLGALAAVMGVPGGGPPDPGGQPEKRPGQVQEEEKDGGEREREPNGRPGGDPPRENPGEEEHTGNGRRDGPGERLGTPSREETADEEGDGKTVEQRSGGRDARGRLRAARPRLPETTGAAETLLDEGPDARGSKRGDRRAAGGERGRQKDGRPGGHEEEGGHGDTLRTLRTLRTRPPVLGGWSSSTRTV